ncbi:MAG TPA: type I-U CRISPR-associated RAMP protein Csb1/Cas7u [Tepidisphaeraceae bacterium]|nr:type I-U CRISPR-associated RAMP protein Csb1/Cas7u [Tepidisphaeraceae bacterium]
MSAVNVNQFDDWIRDDSDVAALVMRQWLEPVEGKDAVIFPPTYAKPERMPDGDWTGYNIDRLDDGASVCLIDSVGSQANRMEPIFLRDGYSNLVPQITIKLRAGSQEKTVNLLEAGHRAADAIVRFSNLSSELSRAFASIKDAENAEPLAKIAPTSLVFGAWDSRDTQVKLPRIVRSVIRAYDVQPLHRSAQYIPPVDYAQEGVLEIPDNQKDQASELGLRHAPAPWTHGGVQVKREIRRDACLNLAALRMLRAGKDKNADPLPLRRYILGLALVAFTAPQETFLREGCQLVPDSDHPAEWKLARHDGRSERLTIDHGTALHFAQDAANAFGVGQSREVTFDPKAASSALSKTKEERKKAKRQSAESPQG